MSKKIRTLALLFLIPFILTACTHTELPVIGQFFSDEGDGGGEAEVTTITVWGLWEDPTVMASLISKFEEQNPDVKVEYEDRSVMSTPEYKDRVFARYISDSPDVDAALVHNTWVPRMANVLAPMPDNYMDVGAYEERFYAPVVRSGVVNNQVYATPLYYDSLVLVYNKDHFEEVNQNLPPTAWEEFRRLAIELTVRGENNEIERGGAAIGTASNVDHFSDILGLMWTQADVGVTPALAGKTHYGRLEKYNSFINELDTRPAYDALTFYTNFVLQDQVWNSAMPEARQAFVQGKASMIFVPSWQILDIVAAIPNPSSVGVATVPQAIPEEPRAWATFWMFTVPQKSPNKEAAWKFLNFLVQDEQQLLYSTEAAKARIFSQPFPVKGLSDQVTNELLTPVVEMAPYAGSEEIAARAGNVDQVEALRNAVNNVLEGNATSQEALEEVKATLQQPQQPQPEQ